MPKKVLGYEDQGYNPKEALFDGLQQAFENLKQEKFNSGGWNLPAEKISGVTMKLAGDNLTLFYHHYEISTISDLPFIKDDGIKFLKGIEKELKKKFRSITGKTLKLKKIQDDQIVDKQSRLQADTSWQVGSSWHGYHGNPKCRFLIRDSITFEIGIDLV